MLNLNVEELTKGAASENEVDIEMPDLKTFTPKDLETLLDNRGRERYDVGRIAEREIVYKELSKEIGIDTIKNHKDFVGAYKNLILDEAKVEPNQKLDDANSSIEKLRGQITERDSDYLLLQKKVTENQVKFDVKSFIPKMPEGLGVTKDDATSIYFMSHEVKEDGVYKNGALQKDSYETPLTTEESVNSFITEKKWNVTAPPIGRGGGSGGSGSGTPTTMEDYEATLKEKGFTPGSADANALLSQIAKDHPEILD
jgi:hypothetical protein